MANVRSLASSALTEGDGILRLSPTWVPRSFLQPGKRLKLNPNDNQGIRYVLAGHLLELGDTVALKKLIKKYKKFLF